jgi:pimeloyl-ACP methyl ester carboxylesterase
VSKAFYDIKAVADYAKSAGYKKTALIGFSLGGVEGVYAVAQFHNVDALVTVGIPADARTAIPRARWLYWLTNNWFGKRLLRPWVRLEHDPEFLQPVTLIPDGKRAEGISHY